MNQQTNSRSNLTVGPTDLARMLAGWADNGHGTLAQQLAHAIRRATTSGLLADGSRLPAERTVATALSVSRSTVTAAFDELRAEGTVASRQGSGTVVRGLPSRTLVGTRVAEHFSPGPGIDLAVGNPPDASHLPPLQLDVAALMAGGGGPSHQPLGLTAFRTALAERHTADRLLTEPGQIHVTSGAHQAMSLALGALVDRGTPVAVEDPSYSGVFDIIETLGARPVAVRSDRAGLVPDELDRVLTEHRPPVVYVQTGPHNPTGRSPVAARLRALAEVVDRHGTTVVEDGALADLTFAGRVRPGLAELCRRATVVSVGSFDKVAWGGLRTGWMRAPAPFVERTMYLRMANDLGPSVPAQLLALQLLPHLDELAARRRATLAELVDRALERLAADLPEWRVEPPAGGSFLWVELPVADTGAFALHASRHGVHITPGSIATAARASDPHIRICVDRPWAVLEEGIKRLGHAWRETVDSGGRRALAQAVHHDI